MCIGTWRNTGSFGRFNQHLQPPSSQPTPCIQLVRQVLGWGVWLLCYAYSNEIASSIPVWHPFDTTGASWHLQRRFAYTVPQTFCTAEAMATAGSAATQTDLRCGTDGWIGLCPLDADQPDTEKPPVASHLSEKPRQTFPTGKMFQQGDPPR